MNNLDDEVEDEFFDQNDNTSLVHSFVREEDSAKKESIRIIHIEDGSWFNDLAKLNNKSFLNKFYFIL